jgi:hypothetical protein
MQRDRQPRIGQKTAQERASECACRVTEAISVRNDILRSPDALRNAMPRLRPGAWVAAGGGTDPGGDGSGAGFRPAW